MKKLTKQKRICKVCRQDFQPNSNNQIYCEEDREFVRKIRINYFGKKHKGISL